jgi:cytochrome c oxidase subunit III
MNPEDTLLTAEQYAALEHTALLRRRLESQYENLDQQHQAASLGMWVFLATEVMFFGALFLSVAVYRYLYAEEFEKASQRLNWMIGGVNTLVLLLSSLMIVLAVHYVQHGGRKKATLFLGLTALLGMCFLGFKGLEYYLDYVDNLIPGVKFEDKEWIDSQEALRLARQRRDDPSRAAVEKTISDYGWPISPQADGDAATTREGLRPDQVPHVKLFLFLYWVMTGLHGLHVTIGIVVVLVMLVMTWRGAFSATYYAPLDVTALYWHFVDVVWIFLLPTLYLLGTHHWGGQ